MQSRRSLLNSSLPGALLLAAAPALASPMPDDDIGALLAREVDQVHFSTGLVAGVLDAKGGRVLAHGRSDGADARPLDGDTVFDIGSLTKLFTALTLADMAVKGEVAMDDPLAKYVPPGVEVPDYAGRKITLLDLATYSPGLPGWPQNMPPLSPDKPFPDYSTGMLYQALSSTRLETAPGTQYVYSNFGYGLLGLALASRAGTDFESLVIARAVKPLGMDSTRIVLTPAMQSRYAGGHDRKLARVTSWNLPPAFAGAGAFRSTANDLLRFLGAAMGFNRSALAPAFGLMLKTLRQGDKPGTRVGAGWFVTAAPNGEMIWKDGGVLGYTSFLGYVPGSRKGVVLLANALAETPDLGKHLLDPDLPLPK